MRAIHLSPKPRPWAYRPVSEMAFTKEMQRVDRELHLELAESPINPAFIHMSPLIPSVNFTHSGINVTESKRSTTSNG